MEKSTKKKIWIGVAIVAGAAAGAGAIYYQMRKNTMDPEIPLDLEAPKKSKKGLKAVGEYQFVPEERNLDLPSSSFVKEEKQFIKKKRFGKKEG